MYWWSACLQDGISYKMLCFTDTCLTGGHVLLEGMYHRRACFAVRDVFWGTCFTRGHISQDDLLYKGTPYKRTGLIGGYVL